MYRPWGDKNPCVECPKKVEDEYGLFCDLACGLFTRYCYKEAGADAMLEALKEKGIYVDVATTVTNNVNPDTFHQFQKGWLVFIPEEK